MPTVPIPLAGGTYKSISAAYSAQSTNNLWFESIGGGRSATVMHGFPGLKAFSPDALGVSRGLGVHNGNLFIVAGDSLYSVSSGGVVTFIGAISEAGQCCLVSDGNYLVITTGGDAYYYDGTLHTITDADLESPNTACFNNSRIIYDGNNGRFCVADVGQPWSIDGLNFATAESAPDGTVAVFDHKQYVYICGTNSIEPWYNSGSGNPPYDRVNGAVMSTGLGAAYSVGKNEGYAYFIDSNGTPKRISGITLDDISDNSIANEIRQYDTYADAVGFCYKLNNENFYQVNFPTANKSWVYQESVNIWSERSSGSGMHRANSYAKCYGKHLVSDYETGQILELDFETRDDNGEYISRERATQTLHGGMVDPSLEGKPVTMSRLELVLEAGVGVVTGQGETPQVMLQWSDDGVTWSNELWVSCGAMGKRYWRAQWFCLGQFVSRVYRFRLTDPVKCAWISCNADVEVGI